MFWYGHGVSGWAWIPMTIGMVVFWGVLITLAVLVFRAISAADRPAASPTAPTPPAAPPERMLAERFARGEIDEDEYVRALAVLRRSPETRPAAEEEPYHGRLYRP